VEGADTESESAGHVAVGTAGPDKLQDAGLAWGQQRLAVGVTRCVGHWLVQQGGDGGGLPEVRAQQIEQLPLLAGKSRRCRFSATLMMPSCGAGTLTTS
jgi:hypothetical protein